MASDAGTRRRFFTRTARPRRKGCVRGQGMFRSQDVGSHCELGRATFFYQAFVFSSGTRLVEVISSIAKIR